MTNQNFSGTGHGGNIHLATRNQGGRGERLLDFSANINPLGPPRWLRQILSRSIENIVHYPDPDSFELVKSITKHHAIPEELIVVANGTTDLLYLLPRILKCKRAIIPSPSYIDYKKVMELNNVEVVQLILRPENSFDLDFKEVEKVLQVDDVVIVGSPNNPTANIVDPEKILELAKKFPQSYFLIDEAFLDFLDNVPSLAGQGDNIITLNSMTKFFAIPGLRLGFGVFPLPLAEKIRHLLPPWTVNSLAQAVGARLFEDKEYHQNTISTLRYLRDNLYKQLLNIADLRLFSSEVNYFLIQIRRGPDAKEVATKLLQKNILIRVCQNYDGLDESYFRVAVRTTEENEGLVNALTSIFSKKTIQKTKKKKKSRSLMIQGTSSNAGKSVIVAAFCRILIQDGIRVAPFKAQNMSLNSFVTHNGLEMGRAQVVQAQASRLDPDVRMNPVLLKPNSDIGSQVIVNGKPVGNMSVQQYVNYKEKAGAAACQNYDSLADEYDVILLEGAGSPGEVNLKHHDIVNMNMARHAKSPVLLVGDIDRGGVYASFIGTMEVLDEWERNLIAGFLVNRFRGDASLLQTAHDYVRDHTGKNVLATIPYIQKLGIPEEDSVSFKDGRLQKNRPAEEHVEIALINLPHISNFTDIEPFLEEPDVHLQIVESLGDLGKPDCIIIPGSKNVVGDIHYLFKSGMAKCITSLADRGCEIVGICGGYQILGKSVHDPHFIESDGETISALSLLDLKTVLAEEKTLVRRSGKHRQSGLAIHGYEIHHGLSTSSLEPVLVFEDGSFCGTKGADGNIWGAYLHGIFDADLFRRWFIDDLRKNKGLAKVNTILAPYDLELSFDNLAKIVRESTEMDEIYKLLDI